jgi:hypothetical protein
MLLWPFRGDREDKRRSEEKEQDQERKTEMAFHGGLLCGDCRGISGLRSKTIDPSALGVKHGTGHRRHRAQTKFWTLCRCKMGISALSKLEISVLH